MHPRTEEKVSPLNIRIKAHQRKLIEEAAGMAEKTVSDFVREAALRKAENILLDQTTIRFTDSAWEEFTLALDAKPDNNTGLYKLMGRRPVWKK